MTELRSHLDQLIEHGDLMAIEERVHWDGDVAAIAAEALEANAPAVRYASTPGTVGLLSGVYGTTDRFTESERPPWRRFCTALDLPDCSYIDLLERLSTYHGEKSVSSDAQLETDAPITASPVDGDLYSLGLPSFQAGSTPQITLALISAERDGQSTWAPVCGEVYSHDTLRLSVPKHFVEWANAASDVSVMLGAPASALVAAIQHWTQDRIDVAVPAQATMLSGCELGTIGSLVVPASTEVLITGQLRIEQGNVDCVDTSESWELLCETVPIEVDVDQIALRTDSVVPFAPLGAPLADDVLLASLAEAAQLYHRVNSYWGVSPVNWIQLPVEARLGLCIVSSDILYAGFEWQLANALFSFSRVFDKVLVLDDEANPENLSRAIDDMWVKAHPANDWIFGEPNAPRASAPRYRRSTETGSKLYIDATWDLSWDEEYIAPRVTYENSYPQNIREAIDTKWNRFGLPEREDE